jgi:hypothetical protein
MSEYLTPANVAIAVSLLMALYSLIKTIAPKTKTTIDDDIVAFVERARPWVRDFAGPVWALVEQLQKQGKILKNGKYGEYLTILRDAFKQTYGQDMPKALEVDAQLMAQGLSAADKLVKESVVLPTGTPITSVTGTEPKGYSFNPTPSQDAAK